MSLQSRGSQAIDRAVRKSIETGLPYVVSAGNQGGDACRNSPSRVREAITVGATNAGDQRAPFSNDGACVDLFAPGAGIESAWNTGDEASELMSGTSMASPHVAGAVALLLAAHPRATPAQLASLLLDQSTPGVVTDAGETTPNRLLYVKDELSDLT
ncbi:MAG: S8 family serine peptidase [Nonomuraea sp.]|nr:S8 family serine peptidase [Nonomuraea sp.]